jgi:phage-related holin
MFPFPLLDHASDMRVLVSLVRIILNCVSLGLPSPESIRIRVLYLA